MEGQLNSDLKFVKTVDFLLVPEFEGCVAESFPSGNHNPPFSFRGLLLPKVAEDRGVQRTDVGNLGSGIYFSDSLRLVSSVPTPIAEGSLQTSLSFFSEELFRPLKHH
jgi:hypothetical protein